MTRAAALRWSTLVAVALLAVALAAGAVRFARHQWGAVSFPYPLDYGEGPILDQAAHLSRLETIYPRDFSQRPYRVANYPPLHPLLQAPLVRAFGPAYWYGRLLAMAGTVGAACCVGLILRTLTRDGLAALAGSLVFLSFPHVLDWSRLNRVDGLALGLGAAALATVAHAPGRRGARVAAALLLTAAIFTRQSHALAAPLAACVWVAAREEARDAAELAAVVAGSCLGLVVLLQALTGGAFLLHVVTANVNPFYWPRVWPYLAEVWAQAPWLVAGALAFAVAGRRETTWWLAAPYLVGAAASALTIGKVGSGVNYLYELFLALALSAGALLAWSRRWPWLRVGLVLLLAAQTWALNRWTIEHREGPLRARLAQRAEVDRLSEIVRATPGPVLADEMMGLLPLHGRPIEVQPFEFRTLEYAGLWSDARLAHEIDARRFALILLYEPPDWDSPRERWSDRLREAIRRRYRRVERLADNGVYRPAD